MKYRITETNLCNLIREAVRRSVNKMNSESVIRRIVTESIQELMESGDGWNRRRDVDRKRNPIAKKRDMNIFYDKVDQRLKFYIPGREVKVSRSLSRWNHLVVMVGYNAMEQRRKIKEVCESFGFKYTDTQPFMMDCLLMIFDKEDRGSASNTRQSEEEIMFSPRR